MDDATALPILGEKPRHILGGPSSVANEQAMGKMIWAPGIDDGYVPQGLAWAAGSLYVSGYRSTDTKVDQGPCRLFKVNAETGQVQGHFDLPADCGHAGGVAHIGGGILVVSDTRRLYRIDSAKAFTPHLMAEAVTGRVMLRGELKGSFVDFDGKAVFAGAFEKDASKAKGHFLSPSLFDTHHDKSIDERIALRAIALPEDAQGAAFDPSGALWISSSSSKFGKLYKLDTQTGQVLGGYDMVVGIEDLAFDDQGRLWSLSEAGSLRWMKWSKTFPVLFRMDVNKLK
jgi:hypothetical protein